MCVPYPGVKEARNTMEVIMSTPTQHQLVWDRRKAILDRKSEIEEAREQGMAQGMEARSKEIYDRMIAGGIAEAEARKLVYGE